MTTTNLLHSKRPFPIIQTISWQVRTFQQPIAIPSNAPMISNFQELGHVVWDSYNTLLNICAYHVCLFVYLYGEGRPRLDLEYPVYGASSSQTRELLPPWLSSPPVPSGFRRGRDLNPRPSLQGKLVECNEINH